MSKTEAEWGPVHIWRCAGQVPCHYSRPPARTLTACCSAARTVVVLAPCAANVSVLQVKLMSRRDTAIVSATTLHLTISVVLLLLLPSGMSLSCVFVYFEGHS